MSEVLTQAQEAASDKAFAVGQTVKFKAYAVAPKPGEPAPFNPGDILTLVKVGPDEKTECYDATRTTDGTSSTVYFDEIESYTPPAEATAPVKSKGGKKADPEAAAKKAAEKAEAKAKKDAEAAAKKAAAEVEANKPLILTESVKALISDDAQKTIEAAETLSKQIDTNEFTLGGVLAAVRRDNIQNKLLGDDQQPLFSADKAGFEAYINARLSCGYRKAMYLIQMYEKYSTLGVSEEEIAKIGWTKAVMMLPAITAENKDAMLEFAQTHNKTEVEAHVKSTKVNSGSTTGNSGTRGVRHAFNFNLYNNDGEAAKGILSAAVETLSAEDKKDEKAALNKAFNLILTEWSQFKAAANAAAAQAPVAATPAV